MKMKSLITAIFCLAATGASAIYGSTGSYCDVGANTIDNYTCGFQPDPGWVSSGDGCFHYRAGQCSVKDSTNPVFDGNTYAVLNRDVDAAGVDRLWHWKNYGQAEGRSGSFLYDPHAYTNANPGLLEFYNSNWKSILEHYIYYGLWEGRTTLYAGTPDLSWPVFIGVNPPKDGSYNFVSWRVGTESDPNIFTHLDTSYITGLPNAYQRGSQIKGTQAQRFISGAWGFTGVQKYGDEFGIGIDSRPVKDVANAYSRVNKQANPSVTYNTLPVVLSREFDPNIRPRVWGAGQNGILTNYTLRLPFAGGTNGGGSQLVSYYLIRDVTSGQQIYIGAMLFDTRPNMDGPAINIGRDNCGSGCSGNYIISAPLTPNSPFLTSSGFSSPYTSTPFAETRAYEWRITPTNLQNILNQIPNDGSNTSRNPANYEIMAWILNPEVFAPIDAAGNMVGDGWIGLSGKINISVGQ
jgi:hypothetical protein